MKAWILLGFSVLTWFVSYRFFVDVDAHMSGLETVRNGGPRTPYVAADPKPTALASSNLAAVSQTVVLAPAAVPLTAPAHTQPAVEPLAVSPEAAAPPLTAPAHTQPAVEPLAVSPEAAAPPLTAPAHTQPAVEHLAVSPEAAAPPLPVPSPPAPIATSSNTAPLHVGTALEPSASDVPTVVPAVPLSLAASLGQERPLPPADGRHQPEAKMLALDAPRFILGPGRSPPIVTPADSRLIYIELAVLLASNVALLWFFAPHAALQPRRRDERATAGGSLQVS